MRRLKVFINMVLIVKFLNKYIEKHYKNDYIQHYSDGYKLENSIPFKVKSELSKFVGFHFLLNKRL